MRFYTAEANGKVGLADPMIVGLIFLAVLWRFGESARQLDVSNERLTKVSAELRREQEARERRAITEERIRIARELHDVVAHHVSVISVQTGLAQYVLESEPEVARDALSVVMDVSEEALEEMRRVLALLRPGDEDAGPVGGESAGLAYETGLVTPGSGALECGT